MQLASVVPAGVLEEQQEEYRVLIVDDDTRDQMLYRAGLDTCREARFSTDSVGTGNLGLLQLASEKYDCVLLDYMLPDGQGMALVEKFRQAADDPDLPIILLTGYGDEDLAIQALHSRVSDYLHKRNVNPQSLYRAIANSVAKATLRRTARIRQITIENMNRELLQKNREIEAFYQSVSHELKTPLTAIREYTSLVIDGIAGDIPSEAEDFLSVSLECTDRLARLVDDLFDAARIESGKLTLARKSCFLPDIAERAIRLVEDTRQKSSIDIRLQVADEMPSVMLDFDRVLQVFVNLLTNALKFTQPGGWIEISLAVDRDKQVALAGVRDNGRGIADDDLLLVFDKLYQACEGDMINHSGMGIGLHLCRNIVATHGGDIWVTSALNEGSLFEFSLPLVPSDVEMVSV